MQPKKHKLCEGMRKNISVRVQAWGGHHVPKREDDIVLIIDSDEYENIPNMSITTENGFNLIPQILSAAAQTVMGDLMFGRLEIKDFYVAEDGEILHIWFKNKDNPHGRPIHWEIDLGLDKLIKLKTSIEKIIDNTTYNKNISFINKL